MEPADRSVGIMGEAFCPEVITDCETGEILESWTHFGSTLGGDDDMAPQCITDGEMAEITQAVQDSQPFDEYEHLVRSWQMDQEWDPDFNREDDQRLWRNYWLDQWSFT